MKDNQEEWEEGGELNRLGGSATATGSSATATKEEAVKDLNSTPQAKRESAEKRRGGKEAEDERQQLTPYSFRHRYAYVGHNRQKDDGTYRAPKQIADAMGHSLDVHLGSYSRFMTKELAKNFDQETVKAS